MGVLNTTEEELELHLGDLFFFNHGWNERTNKAYYKLARKVVLSALERDDAEFVAKVKQDGALHLPSDFRDISREDILNGEYLSKEL